MTETREPTVEEQIAARLRYWDGYDIDGQTKEEKYVSIIKFILAIPELQEGQELLELRPAVKAFALAMEAVLKQHDDKGGWSPDDCSVGYLQTKLAEETAELFRGICADEEPDNEAVDLANLAMMLWTRYRYMGEKYQE